MPYTHTYAPPDARSLPAFDVIRGLDTSAKRIEFEVNYYGTSTRWNVEVGEPVVSWVGTGFEEDAFKVSNIILVPNAAEFMGIWSIGGGDDPVTPLGLSFDRFSVLGSEHEGFPCANGRGKLAVLTQVFKARINANRFVTDADDLSDGLVFPVGTPAAGGGAFDAAFIAGCVASLEVGSDVVVVKTAAGEPKFCTLPNDYNVRTGEALTPQNHRLDDLVVGHITKKITVNGDDFVEVLFKF